MKLESPRFYRRGVSKNQSFFHSFCLLFRLHILSVSLARVTEAREHRIMLELKVRAYLEARFLPPALNQSTINRLMSYWLIKSEPSVYSIEAMEREGTCIWDGVRNYQARNFLRRMNRGDDVFFYHSNTKYPGIAGLVTVIESDVIDPTQFDPNSPYYDPKSTLQSPRWQTVRVRFMERFHHFITLAQLKQTFTADDLLLVRRGNRLSVMPVSEEIAQQILTLGQQQNQQN